MKSMTVSAFEARCVEILKEVHRQREGVIVTLRGRALAVVQPVPEPGTRKRLGALRGSMKIRRDLVRTHSSADWEMLR